MRRFALLAVAASLALAGCDHQRPHDTSEPKLAGPTVTETPRYVPAPQTVWMHGVGIDVPAKWPRNELDCGRPFHTTVVVEPATAAFPLCVAIPPKHAHPNVAWLGAYLPPLRPGGVLGLVGVPAGGLAAMTRTTIDGVPAWTWEGHDPETDQPAVLVVVPSREIFVAVTSRNRSTRDSIVSSIRFAPKDPATRCATRTTAYDAAPRHPRLDRAIDVSGAVAVVACHYVAGWLESTATSMSAAKLRTLVHAIRAAPHVTSARAPEDTGCAGLDPGPPAYSDDGPVVLRFAFADGHSAVVVVRVVNCTRWQSYLYAGNVERRLTGAVLLALPPVLVQFPGPDSM